MIILQLNRPLKRNEGPELNTKHYVMKSTTQAFPGAEVCPFNVYGGTKLMEILRIHLALYNENRGEMVNIELAPDELSSLAAELGCGDDPRLMHLIAEEVNTKFIESPDYGSGYMDRHPDPQPQLTVVRQTRFENGAAIKTGPEVFQILLPYNYYPKEHDGQIVDGEYVMPS